MNSHAILCSKLIIVLILLSLFANNLHASEAQDGRTYHISQILGSDLHPGTADKPFLTITKCADIAEPGDTCLVHEGIYRETVRPSRDGLPNKAIKFLVAENDNVIVTGLDKVTSRWKKINSFLFRTTPEKKVKQVFFKNNLATIARSPNYNSPFKPHYHEINVSKCKTSSGDWTDDSAKCEIFDEDGLCGESNNCWDKSFPKKLWRIKSDKLIKSTLWRGGVISIVDKGSFNMDQANIDNVTQHYEIEFVWFSEKNIEPGMKFNIINSLPAINFDQEWAYDTLTEQLFYKTSDEGQLKNIFIRTRDLAFDLREKSYIKVVGFKLFAASIETGPFSEGCAFEKLEIKFPVYHQYFGATKNFPGQGSNRHKIDINTAGKGITLGGSKNILSKSKISHSWCDGVSVYGTDNVVTENHIYDVNWGMTACAAIASNGTNHIIEKNLLHDCGRSCLWFQKTFESEFSYNEIFNACWLGKDCGIAGSIAWYGENIDLSSDINGDGIGNVIHHNWIHDNKNPYGGACLYLDNNEQDYLVHHNVLWNCKFAFIINNTFKDHGKTGHQIVNNTCFDVEYRLSDFGKNENWKLSGISFINNLCTSSLDAHYNPHSEAEIKLENNIGPGNVNSYAQLNKRTWSVKDLNLLDIDKRDFRLGNSSPAIGQGKTLSGILGTMIKTPYVGAYGDGSHEPWKAGIP